MSSTGHIKNITAALNGLLEYIAASELELTEHRQNELRWRNARDIWEAQDNRKEAEIDRLREIIVSLSSGGVVALSDPSGNAKSQEQSV